MKSVRNLFIGLALLTTNAARAEACPPSLSIEKRASAGDETVKLCEAYRGKVVLNIKTASRSAFTPQYEGLEALYSKYKYEGPVVLDFPGNDFGGQEPGDEGQVNKLSAYLRRAFSHG